ncbi:hypothetical protein Ade02nite_21690 [Paractinoplanes deccanensis]|uniref:DUF1990 domain-containing protein n=1 Tax=Paractinoplanes deccanensis TaxID=113561 RepID=A0ABQ3Y0L3_9ACTN|nr:hypothetical protein Ade02nite_21690 [Actinoplanes deccanensis]
MEAKPEAVALAGLAPVHYREGFALDTDARLSAEEWARLILEGAPRLARAKMLLAWTLLGVDLAPLRSPNQVLGWRIQHNTPDTIVLSTRATAGVTARLILHIAPATNLPADPASVVGAASPSPYLFAGPPAGGAVEPAGDVHVAGAARLTHVMLVRYDRGLGRHLWTRFAPAHRRFYVGLLARAGDVAR